MKSSHLKRRSREWENSTLEPILKDKKRHAIHTPLTAQPESFMDHDDHILNCISSVRRIDDFFFTQQPNNREEIISIKKPVADKSLLKYNPLNNCGQHIVCLTQDHDLSQVNNTLDGMQICSAINEKQSKKPFSSPVPNKNLFFISPYCSKSKAQEETLVELKDLNTSSYQQSHQRCYICNQLTKPHIKQDFGYTDSSYNEPYQINSSKDTRYSLLRYFPSTKSTTMSCPTQPFRVHNTNPMKLKQHSTLEPCSFCDRVVCHQSCIRSCERCLGRFCTFCSTVNYNCRLERIYCLDCNTTIIAHEAITIKETLDSMDLS